MKIQSKLPNVGETIFTTISSLARENKAVNLGQGFPDFPGNSFLKERINSYINDDYNQYAPMIGVESLRLAISSYFKRKYSLEINHNTEITITSGATEALTASILSLVNRGDEVIVFDPSYDSYVPAIEMVEATPVRLNLTENNFKLPLELLKETISEKTKMIIINSPHNPTGSSVSQNEWESISELIKDKNIFILSDEVYEGICFTESGHFCPRAISSLKDKLISVYSFGKSCHMTGWKVGHAIANEDITKEIRKFHQYITFSTFSAAQFALADYLSDKMDDFLSLSEFYEKKKLLFIEGLKKTKFKVLDSDGTYFVCADYSEISSKSDIDFVIELIKEHGIATIPISGFYKTPPKNQKVIRFCIAKEERTLNRALEILKSI